MSACTSSEPIGQVGNRIKRATVSSSIARNSPTCADRERKGSKCIPQCATAVAYCYSEVIVS